MKINKKYIFNRFFWKESKELEEKRKMVKILNELLNENKIALKAVLKENNALKSENNELKNSLKEAKINIIKSNEYKTLLEKYNELLNKK